MATSVPSYEIIFLESRQIVMVNARAGERVDNRLIINPSPTHVATIQYYEDFDSLFDDGGPAYTTHFVELKPNHRSVVTPTSSDGSNVLDHETCVKITNYIMNYEALRADDS
jgi:hypothetical protein